MSKFFDFSALKKICFSVNGVVRIAVVAALYFALTLFIAPIAYGPVQFRLSETLMLLCFFNPEYIISMIIGCALANIVGPFGLADVIFGSAATAVAAILMSGCKNIWISSIFPTITNGLLIGFMLFFFFNEPIVLSILTVSLGEFMVVSVSGVALFRFLFMKYPVFMKLIGALPEKYLKKI
ncbi:MAG: QueT transporter family protein [Eubacterium sp.]|jgi:uncharacterized membrane protein|nr:QueT transporter family protein [Eubacterium sp.]